MIERTIKISGKDVAFRSSATVPRLYRAKFKRDIFKDLSKLEKSFTKKTDEGTELQIDDLEIFENVAYIMAFHADPSIPKTIDEWLDQFEMFSIYEVLPEILELWGENLMTDVEAKKGLAEPYDGCRSKKRTGRSEREMTTPLFLLRCTEVGISIADLDLLTIGLVLDIWTEKSNDGVKYRRIADQSDFDKF